MGLRRFIVSILAISGLSRVKVVGLSGTGIGTFADGSLSGASCTSIDSLIEFRAGSSYCSIFPFIVTSFSSCSSCSTGGLGWQIAAASSSSAFSITIGSWRDDLCVIASAVRVFRNATFYANQHRRATPADQGFSNFHGSFVDIARYRVIW